MCEHHNFAADVTVNRLEDSGRFTADVRIECADCGTPFRFIGLPCGVDLNGAAVSVDGTEGRLAVAPKGEVVTPIDPGAVGGFTVRRVSGRCDACGEPCRPNGRCTRPGCCNSD